MRNSKLRTVIVTVVALQAAFVLAAAANAGPVKDKASDSTTVIAPGLHRGG